MLVSINGVFLNDDDMMNQRPTDRIILKETREETVPNSYTTELNENTPYSEPVVTSLTLNFFEIKKI